MKSGLYSLRHFNVSSNIFVAFSTFQERARKYLKRQLWLTKSRSLSEPCRKRAINIGTRTEQEFTLCVCVCVCVCALARDSLCSIQFTSLVGSKWSHNFCRADCCSSERSMADFGVEEVETIVIVVVGPVTKQRRLDCYYNAPTKKETEKKNPPGEQE